MKNVSDQLYVIVRHCGMTIQGALDCPIWMRKFFVKKKQEQWKRQKQRANGGKSDNQPKHMDGRRYRQTQGKGV